MASMKTYICNACGYQCDCYEGRGFFGQKISQVVCKECHTVQQLTVGGIMDVEDAITEAINKVAAVKINADNAYLLGSSSDTLMVLSKEIPMTGAYSEYRTITDEDKALFRDTYKGEITLTPAKVSTQVVAGINYSFLCKDKNGKVYVVVIYQPLPGQGVPEVTSVTMK